jgi:hypothetical protein
MVFPEGIQDYASFRFREGFLEKPASTTEKFLRSYSIPCKKNDTWSTVYTGLGKRLVKADIYKTEADPFHAPNMARLASHFHLDCPSYKEVSNLFTPPEKTTLGSPFAKITFKIGRHSLHEKING